MLEKESGEVGTELMRRYRFDRVWKKKRGGD
jgi:hypothetical protein